MDTRSVNVLSLAAGAGGLELGVKLAIPAARLVCAVEIEAYACEVLASRMEEGRLDDAPVWTDLRTFDGRPWRGVVDLLTAGYPCQPFSHAGQRRGAEDPRHLWPHVMRIVCECRPAAVFLENVAGHLSLGFREVREDLERMGYQVEAGLFAAVEAGAPHRRARLFALAHHHHHRLEGVWRGGLFDGERTTRGGDAHRRGGAADVVGHTDRAGLEGRGLRGLRRADERAPWPPGPEDTVGWREYLARWPGLEPSVRGGSDGLADKLDRLRLTGNGVVPAQAALAFTTLAARLLLAQDEAA